MKDETLKRLSDLFLAQARMDLSLVLDAAYNSGVADGIERQARSIDSAMDRIPVASIDTYQCWHCQMNRDMSELVHVRDIGYICADRAMCDATQVGAVHVR